MRNNLKLTWVIAALLFITLVMPIGSAVGVLAETGFVRQGTDNGQSGIRGLEFVTNSTSLTLRNATVDSFTTMEIARICADKDCNTILANSTGKSGNVFSFNAYVLQPFTTYYLIATTASSASISWTNSPPSYPVRTAYLNWTRSDTTGTLGTSNMWAFTSMGFDTIDPVVDPVFNVTLTAPANNSVVTATHVNITAVGNITFGNFTNITFIAWYSNSTELNRTTFAFTGNTSNRSSLNISLPPSGQIFWNARVCATNATGFLANCSFAPGNFTFFVGASANFTYTANTYETAFETFLANISIIPGTSITQARLFYNGTIHNGSTVTLVSSNMYAVNKSIDVPLNPNPFANTTRNWFWIIDYLGGAQENLTVQRQNVSFINLQLCNTTFNLPSLNFTIKNESNFVEINGSIQANFAYWLGGTGRVSKNYSINSSGAAGPARYDFCIYPNPVSLNKNFTANMIMSYTAPDFVERFYLLSGAMLTNATSLIDLMLIPNTIGVKFFIDVKQGVTVIGDAIVYVAKQYISLNTYKTIGLRQTDNNGRFIEYLELDTNYQATVIRNGTVLGVVNFVSICASSPCELTLQLPTTSGDIFAEYNTVFASNIVYNLSFNQTSKIVTFTYIDLTGLAQYARLSVDSVSLNETGNNICNNFLFSVSGTITCNVSGYSGDFRATTYISRSPEKIIDYITFFISGLKDSLGKTGLLLALLIGSVVCGILFYYDLSIGILGIPVVLTALKVVDFLPLSWTPIIGIWVGAIYLAGKVRA